MKSLMAALAAMLSLLMPASVPAQSPPPNPNINVAPGDTNALIAAMNLANSRPGDDQIILGGGEYVVSGELPPITSDKVTVVGNGSTLRGSGSGHGLFEVGGSGKLVLSRATVAGFDNDQAGGAISVAGTGYLQVSDVTFTGNRSTRDGGAISISGNAFFAVFRGTFSGNSAGGAGGALSFTSTGNDSPINGVYGVKFVGNTAGGFGCNLNLAGSLSSGKSFEIRESQFEADSSCRAIVENPSTRVVATGNTLVSPVLVDQVHTTSPFFMTSNIFSTHAPVPPQSAAKAICSDFGSNALVSLGGNLSSDASCRLTHPTDQANVDPRLGPKDARGFFTLAANSPAIDRGASTISVVDGVPRLPCGHADLRGLGRPQDGNLDGVFACDSGSYEVQGGPNVGNAVSAAYFDTTRNGEGTFIESIGGGQAFVATFTYGPTGGLVWFVGVGTIVGNSVVVDDTLITSGGVFGAAFNPASIVRTPVGSASFVFPTCEASAQPGRWIFRAAPGNGFEDVISRASRLTSIVPCTGNAGPNAGRSGSFYATNRDGEGIFVQFLPDNRVVVIWYTYDAQGRQFWTISSEATVSGNVVSANMVYPAQTTRFGSQFNPAQIQLQPWGTVTLTYTGCNAMTFAYNSSVAGFGSGQYNYTRLTSIQGTTCTQ